MSKIFKPNELFDGNWAITIDLDKFEIDGENVTNYFASSYNVVPARLLGFTYSDYLRWCRSCGAELRGKVGYTHPLWHNENECKKVCDLLNKEWDRFVAEFG